MAFHKKALTTPVAMILALMMVIAASTSLLFWVTRLQGQEQGSIESSQTKLFDNLASCINIPQFDYNVLDNTSNIVMENCGNKNLDVGDAMLVDNGIVSSQPCSFVLNSTTCSACPFTLGISSVKAFTLYWNATTCAPFINEGEKHQLTIYVDKKATASKTFVPKKVVDCGVSITNNSVLSLQVAAAGTAFYNLTLTNAGNAQDVFSLTNTTIGQCGQGTSGIYNTNWQFISGITSSSSTSNIFYVNQTIAGGPTRSCNTTISATSTNCQSKTTNMLLQTTSP